MGTSPGGNQIFNQSTGTARTVTVTKIPTGGSPLFVRLWTRLAAGWVARSYGFTAANIPQLKAGLVAPAAGTKLAGSTVTFSWDTGAGADQYWLDVNTGSATLFFNQSTGLSTQATVANLPVDGRPLTVRVWTHFASGWVFNAYAFTAAGTANVNAAMIAPVPSSKLTGTVSTFQWSAGTNAQEYWLDVNAGGSTLLFNRSTGLATQVTVSGLPSDGRALTVRLWSKFSSTGWSFNSYNYVASGTPTVKAALTSPAASSQLPAGPVTFVWSAGSGGDEYWLQVSSGGLLHHNQSTGLALQATVNGLPQDGRALVVRLWTHFPSGWTFSDFPVTAANTVPVPTSPFDQFQRHNLDVVNAYRATKGLVPLVLDERLNAFAQAGTQQLSVDHLPHQHFRDRINAGTLFTTDGFQGSAAENQGDPDGWTVLSSDPTTNELLQIEDINRAMFNEGPGGGHYENMMNPAFRRLGVGLLMVNGELYLTNDFSQ